MVDAHFIWKYFHKGKNWYKTDRTHKEAWCRACLSTWVKRLTKTDILRVEAGTQDDYRSDQEIYDEAKTRIEIIVGKVDRLMRHIAKCSVVDDDIRTFVSLRLSRTSHTASPSQSSAPNTSVSSDPQPGPPLKKSKTFHDFGSNTAATSTASSSLSTSERQTQFSKDLCRLLILLNTPWVAANNPALRQFVNKWIDSSLVVPDRRILSGKVLDGVVQEVEEQVMKAVKGKLATGQCDGWKNVAKTAIVSSVMTVENEAYLVETHDVTRDPKTGDNLYRLVKSDRKLMEDKYGVIVIAWCTDDGPDGKKMRRMLQLESPSMIVILCWAHQINLVVGDTLAIRRDIMDNVNRALDIIKWFNNHGTALELLRQEQALTFDGQSYSLILPALTRWTHHYMAVTRIIKVKSPLLVCWARYPDRLITCAGTKEDLKEKARSIQATIQDESFWVDIQTIQKILEPLAIAANVSQSSHTHLDHILLTFGNLFRIFSDTSVFAHDISDGVLRSLEKRWAKADQDIFIAAVFLNPWVRGRLFKNDALSENDLFNIVKRVYERVFCRQSDLFFMQAFEDYKRGRSEFSDDSMCLQMVALSFKNQGQPVDLVFLWSRLDKGENKGRNALIKLAIHILSVVANSAGCERVFSNFGITHTKLRNKLDAQKVHKAAVIKQESYREYEAAGLLRKRVKRHFGDVDPPLANPLDSEETLTHSSVTAQTLSERLDTASSSPNSFRAYVEELIGNAVISDRDGSDDMPERIFQAIPQVAPFADAAANISDRRAAPSRVSAGPRKTSIPLKMLFDYSLEPECGLGFYWKAGKEHLYEEEQAYDALLSHS